MDINFVLFFSNVGLCRFIVGGCRYIEIDEVDIVKV